MVACAVRRVDRSRLLFHSCHAGLFPAATPGFPLSLAADIFRVVHRGLWYYPFVLVVDHLDTAVLAGWDNQGHYGRHFRRDCAIDDMGDAARIAAAQSCATGS